MGNDLKWILSSDQQIPYHDKRMIELYFKVQKWFKPDVIDFLGDTSDQSCWSRWEEGTSSEFINAIKKGSAEPMAPFVFEQERPVYEFYEQARKLAPTAEMFVALGNHDIRVWPYFDKKQPDILHELTPEKLWGFDTFGIDYIHYSDRPRHRYGDIFVHHGVSISKHAGESVRNDILDFGVSLVRGHSHRAAIYNKTMPLRNETLRGFELGHMMDINCDGASYQNIHNWQLAFAIAHIVPSTSQADGWYPHIQLIQVNQDYECFVEGKRFAA